MMVKALEVLLEYRSVGLIHQGNPYMFAIPGKSSSTLRMTAVLKDSYAVSIFNLKFKIKFYPYAGLIFSKVTSEGFKLGKWLE